MQDLFGINAELEVEARGKILGTVNIFSSVITFVIGGTHHLPARTAAAGKEHAHRAGPVIAPAARVDLGRAAEFTQADHHGILHHAALIEVIN